MITAYLINRRRADSVRTAQRKREERERRKEREREWVGALTRTGCQ